MNNDKMLKASYAKFLSGEPFAFVISYSLNYFCKVEIIQDILWISEDLNFRASFQLIYNIKFI